MKVKTLLFGLFAYHTISLLSSCGACSKKVDCPGYKDELLDAWFPYNDNQQLIFKNDLNELDTFNLKNTFTTEPYTETGSWERAVTCNAQKKFEAREKDSMNRVKLFIELNVSDDNRDANFYLRETTVNIYDITDAGLLQISINSRPVASQVLSSVTIGNQTFSNVMEAKRDTIKFSGIYQVYFQKGEGLVAYSEYPSLKTWVKQ